MAVEVCSCVVDGREGTSTEAEAEAEAEEGTVAVVVEAGVRVERPARGVVVVDVFPLVEGMPGFRNVWEVAVREVEEVVVVCSG